MDFSVIVLNWNGEELLRKNLPAVLEAVPDDIEMIVVDNGSTDGSIKYVKELTGCGLQLKRAERKNAQSESCSRITVKLIENKTNLGFIRACHQGAKLAKGKFIVLLNNDVIPQKGFLDQILRHFDKPDVFAVSFNEQKYGWAKIWWRGGFIHHGVGGIQRKPHFSAWASGGSAVFRKSMWKKLGGFDELYAPFYWEDFDLGYRAWKKGWRIIWEPKAIVAHKHESTISKLDSNYVRLIKERNQLLFIWKNISDPFLRFTNPLGLFFRVLTGPNYIKVIIAAIKRYQQMGRPREAKSVRSDREILKIFE